MSLPKVSVVSIIYNQEKYVEDMLNGIFIQQYDGPVEVIISNDCSTDLTHKVFSDYLESVNAGDNFDIKYTNQEINKGMLENLFWVFKQATGSYIAICEGDDFWTDPLKLQKQIEFLEENKDYVLCSHRSRIIDDRNADDIKIGEYHTQSQVFRNILDDIYTGFDRTLSGDTFLKYYLMNFGKFKLLDFIGGTYRITGDGVWTRMTKEEQIEMNLKLSKAMIKYFQKNKFKISLRKAKELNFHMRFSLYKSRALLKPFELLDLLIQAISLKDMSLVKSVIALELKRSEH